jgi:hypothetical protein
MGGPDDAGPCSVSTLRFLWGPRLFGLREIRARNSLLVGHGVAVAQFLRGFGGCFLGSCPNPWCNYGGVITAISGLGRIGQTATAGSLTKGSSLTGATDSRVM